MVNHSSALHNGLQHINAGRELVLFFTVTDRTHLTSKRIIYINTLYLIGQVDETGYDIRDGNDVEVITTLITIR